MAERAGENLERFLDLTAWEVEQEATLPRKPGAASLWRSLSNLMDRRGYGVVRELGVPAAASWAAHLGVVPRDRGYATE